MPPPERAGTGRGQPNGHAAFIQGIAVPARARVGSDRPGAREEPARPT